MDHRKEVRRCKLIKVEDARLDRWISVEYAEQVFGRAGTGVSTILCRCKKCGLMFEDEFMLFLARKRKSQEPTPPAVSFCCVHCGAQSEHESGTGIVTMQYVDEEETCVVYQAEHPPQGNCQSVVQGLIMANHVHEVDAGPHKVGSHRRVYGCVRNHTLVWPRFGSYGASIIGRLNRL